MNLGGIDTSRIPTNFYEQEMRNPKRKTGFAYVGKNLLNSNPNKKISKQELEENLIKNEERKYQKELEVFQQLVKILILIFTARRIRHESPF